jgi:hypothetical protein
MRAFFLRLRQALALPVYVISLILDFASAALAPSRRPGRRRRLAEIAVGPGGRADLISSSDIR